MLNSIDSLNPDCLQNIEWLLTDVDDTLTWEGKLPYVTLQALYELEQVGVKVVAVTGACAGWCDQIAKLWPVHGVIGENGAFWMQKHSHGFEVHSELPLKILQSQQDQLKQHLQTLLAQYEDIGFASDQTFRFCDVAINLSQDRVAVSDEIAQELMHKCRALIVDGKPVHATLSSIHLNVWIGDHNKRSTGEAYLRANCDFDALPLEQVSYVGDSLNDEAMFKWLPTTFGVNNISKVLAQLTHKPSHLLEQNGGFGFAQLAQQIVAAKQQHLKAVNT
ncbi:hydrolase [Vibrio sp. UCD-FRSSP16_10]|uniref:HAD-IIB family hydrolase n=1 Tax=unclassified Vibrio TaxID=2614977 RepID=UPI0007FD1EAD|nr:MULTISPECIES: HAD-IIB family hydrolase [unclassified Vibrio]OBT14781.1 hydrolase [Vibrio sp. UCD-FRSSP16_30]OBT20070.1 hydrolase [Vibrio sp. UCD-FRSSP16_10]